MATKTKPKTQQGVSQNIVPFVSLADEDKNEIIDLLSREDASLEGKKTIIEELERFLGQLFHRLAQIGERPMPAHMKAALEEIAILAERLSEKLKRNAMDADVRKFLPHHHPGQIAQELICLATDARVGMNIIEGSGLKSDGGALKARIKNIRDSNLKILEQFFDSQVDHDLDNEARIRNKTDFLQICRKYI